MAIDLNKITPKQKLIIEKGLIDYVYIMKYWKDNDIDFQKIYYDFYLRARWKIMSKPENQYIYFKKLQNLKANESLFDILFYLKEHMDSNSFEFSIATKLLHTRNDQTPIYDSKIRNYLIRQENVQFWWLTSFKNSRNKTKLEQIEHDWHLLISWYKNFLPSKMGREWIAWFDFNFSKYRHISDVKKIDFIIFGAFE